MDPAVPSRLGMTPNALCFGEEFPATGLPCHVEVSSAGLTVRFQEDPLNSLHFSPGDYRYPLFNEYGKLIYILWLAY